MSLHYIIDGYNLVKHRSFRPPAGIHDNRFALIEYLRRNKLCGSRKNKVTIVFDGYSGGEPGFSGIEFEVIFSCDKSADERIKRMVESEPLPRDAVVVSDDRQIRDFARLCGAVPSGIEEFLDAASRKTAFRGPGEGSKQALSYSAVRKINEELKKKWLGK